MITLSRYLGGRVGYITKRIRTGLEIRHSRSWRCDHDQCIGLIGVSTPCVERVRLNRGIRKGVRELRKFRDLQNEYRALREAAK